MKKIIALLLAGLMLFGVAGCSTGSGNSQSGSQSSQTDQSQQGGTTTGDAVEWDLGAIYSDPSVIPDFNGFGWCVRTFCDLVNERSDGQLTVNFHGSGVLGGDVELFNMVRDGEIDMYYGSPMSNADPRFGFTKIPYLFQNFDEVKDVLSNPEGGLFKLLHEVVAEHGCELLIQGVGTFRGVVNSKHEVVAPAECKDLTLRMYEDTVVNAFWKDLCNPTIMPYSEVYTSLQTKAIDGLEMAEIMVIADKQYEVCKYFTDINWQWVGHMLMVNQNSFNALDAEMQQMVKDAAWEARDKEFEIQNEDRTRAYDVMRDYGLTITELTEEQRQPWVDHGKGLYDELRGVIGEEFWDEAMAVMEEAGY